MSVCGIVGCLDSHGWEKRIWEGKRKKEMRTLEVCGNVGCLDSHGPVAFANHHDLLPRHNYLGYAQVAERIREGSSLD